jgi:hypothetical protein
MILKLNILQAAYMSPVAGPSSRTPQPPRSPSPVPPSHSPVGFRSSSPAASAPDFHSVDLNESLDAEDPLEYKLCDSYAKKLQKLLKQRGFEVKFAEKHFLHFLINACFQGGKRKNKTKKDLTDVFKPFQKHSKVCAYDQIIICVISIFLNRAC